MINNPAPLEAVSQIIEHQLSASNTAEHYGDQAHGFMTLAKQAVQGGKMFRAKCALIGAETADETLQNTPAAVTAAAALEVFHAAALVHDDIIDNSDTRRGEPSSHKKLEQHHIDLKWHGDAEKYARAAGILLGDLLLAHSDDLFQDALAQLADPDAAAKARKHFKTMRLEVTVGQYLDIAEESAWSVANDDEATDRALRIASLKSARYSIQQPLQIGAAIAGAEDITVSELGQIGHQLGMAFQLRDDVLGVFGKPETTGKPSGDDLREGKRTVLIAFLRENLTAEESKFVDAAIGDPDLSDSTIASIQQLLIKSGSLDKTEKLIDDFTEAATELIDKSQLAAHTKDSLRQLADAVSRRKL